MADRNGRKSLTLSEALARTPPVNPVEAMRQQLNLAIFDSVKASDVLDLANKIKEKAMAGDLKAARLYFDLVLGKERKPAPEPSTAGIADAIRDLVDEIRIARARTDRQLQSELEALAGDDDEEGGGKAEVNGRG